MPWLLRTRPVSHCFFPSRQPCRRDHRTAWVSGARIQYGRSPWCGLVRCGSQYQYQRRPRRMRQVHRPRHSRSEASLILDDFKAAYACFAKARRGSKHCVSCAKPAMSVSRLGGWMSTTRQASHTKCNLHGKMQTPGEDRRSVCSRGLHQSSTVTPQKQQYQLGTARAD